MSRIDASALSKSFCVVRMTAESSGELLGLYRSNGYYFEYFAIEPTEERLREDMTMLPDGCSAEQKHFVAFYEDGAAEPIALIDLIEGYPEPDVCYIGLFMVRAELTGRGLGTRIVDEVCACLAESGFRAVRLAYGKEYEKAVRFWTKNGFVPLSEAVHEVYGDLIVAQREL